MNENPWRIDDLARLQRGRLQEEMRQIRLEEQALRARQRRPGLIARLWARVQAWLKAPEPPPARRIRAKRPLTLAHAKHHGHI